MGATVKDVGVVSTDVVSSSSSKGGVGESLGCEGVLVMGGGVFVQGGSVVVVIGFMDVSFVLWLGVRLW